LLATAYSGLWSGRLDAWQLSPVAAETAGLVAAPVGALSASASAIALRQVITARDESLAIISPETGAMRWLVPPAVSTQAEPVCDDCAGRTAAVRSYDWYRYQGAADSGPVAHSNCGPTSVAMAIQFAKNETVPISKVRDFIGGSSWTMLSDLSRALKHYDVAHQRLDSMASIDAAIRDRGSIVLVHLWMNWITPGPDLQASLSDPAAHTGRYYLYDQSHWVVLKGYSDDGTSFVVYDPNVWDGNGVYWYNNAQAKGKDRLYPYG